MGKNLKHTALKYWWLSCSSQKLWKLCKQKIPKHTHLYVCKVYICVCGFLCIYFLPRFDKMCTILVLKIIASYELINLLCISCSCADGDMWERTKENKGGEEEEYPFNCYPNVCNRASYNTGFNYIKLGHICIFKQGHQIDIKCS